LKIFCSFFEQKGKICPHQILPAPSVVVGRACPHHARPKGFSFEAPNARGGASRDSGFLLLVEREAAELLS